MVIAGLEVQHAKDFAFQHHGRAEGARVTGRVERVEVEEWRFDQHDEALLAHHSANDAVGRRDGHAFQRPWQTDRGAQGEDAAILIQEDDGPGIHLEQLHAAPDHGVEHP